MNGLFFVGTSILILLLLDALGVLTAIEGWLRRLVCDHEFMMDTHAPGMRQCEDCGRIEWAANSKPKY